MSEQFKNLYLEAKDFDLSIIMGDKVFNVHSWMLKTRSPTFAKLLSEYTQNVIKITPPDKCDSSIFHDILLYIYSGEIENLSLDNVHDIYNAACLFELPHLKEECITFLKESLSIGTITNFLRSAGDNDSELLDVALVFLARNLEDIMFTDEWKQFTGEDPNRTIQYQFKALKIGYTKTIM